MSAGERISLETFAAEAAPDLASSRMDAIAAIRDWCIDLLSQLGEHADLSAQTQRLLSVIVDDLPQDQTDSAVREAGAVLSDLRSKWIAAVDPPLVEEIDDRFAELSQHLEELQHPGLSGLREAARRIDRLAKVGQSMDGIDGRFRNYAIVAGLAFLFGLYLVFSPQALSTTSRMPGLTVLLCLSALPVVAVFYAWRVMPRSRADAEIEELNKRFFLPHGGLYFPVANATGLVTRVTWTPPEDESGKPADPRKTGQRW
ncbi:MAG: hypothetical protein AAF666_20065 [Pseudomonadota bacterium]